jgi:hypothetical protein
MKIDLKRLNQYIEEGWIEFQNHPSLPLRIYNYSRNCQFEEYWDDLTLMCRGLVLDYEGNIIARPFKKFFNLSENKHTPTKNYNVYKKLDGSLGILFNYQGEWIMATRGSFTSEQSMKGFEMLQKYEYDKLNPEYTYLFEIIYHRNRIVVQYDFEDIVLLGLIETKTNKEVNLYDGDEDLRIRNLINNIGFKIIERYVGIFDFTILSSILSSMSKHNEEGFVVRFDNGDRCKIKFDEYVRLHRLLTNFSNVDIWESLKNGDNIEDILKDVPDEFDNWVKSTIRDLKYNYFQISEYCGKAYDGFRYGKFNDKDPEPTKKEYAEYVKQFKKPLQSVMYAMWDKKSYDHIIWRLIRPTYSKPFWNKESN